MGKKKLKTPEIVYDNIEKVTRKDKYNFAELFENLRIKTEKWKSNKRTPQPHLLFRKGVHYDIRTSSMRHRIYRWKYRHDLPLSIRVDTGGKWVRVLWMVD